MGNLINYNTVIWSTRQPNNQPHIYNISAAFKTNVAKLLANQNATLQIEDGCHKRPSVHAGAPLRQFHPHVT